MKFVLFLILPFTIIGAVLITTSIDSSTKMNGVCFVAPPQEITQDDMLPMRRVNANWVAIVPYAFSQPELPEVTFNYPRQWWGERAEGVIATITYAKKLNMKVMLKPHVWVRHQGWAGDYDLASEDLWKRWEISYREYIISYAKIADSLDVELFCIGTEYRQAVVKRPEFWKKLIAEIRTFYDGEITYAANWDNYENVTFWSDLDYIGIDAYFPMSEVKTPTKETLLPSWSQLTSSLENYHKKFDRPILFTEYGYQSVDHASDGHWNYDQDTLGVNQQAQAVAYEALYEAVWSKDWFAGGFLWKWHAHDREVGGPHCKQFTPQNKSSEVVIKKYYGTH